MSQFPIATNSTASVRSSRSIQTWKKSL